MKGIIGLAVIGFLGWQAYNYFGGQNAAVNDLPDMSSSEIEGLMQQLEKANIDVSSLPEINPATAQCYQRSVQDVAKCKSSKCLEREAQALARCAG